MTRLFNVLDPTQKIYGNFLLEASAGTGKTFTIAHLVVRLLLESDPPIPLAKIGTVTFTKAAAFELKSRIKDLLYELKTKLENNQSIFIDTERFDPKELLYRLKLALLDFDQAPISTIHGFSYRILKNHALSLGLKPNLENPEDQAIESLLYDHIKEILSSDLVLHHLHSAQTENLIGSKRGDLHALILALKNRVLSGIEIEELPSISKILIQLEPLCCYELPPFDELVSYIQRFKLGSKEKALTELNILCDVFNKKRSIDALFQKAPFWQSLTQDKLKVRASSVFSLNAERFFNYFLSTISPILEEAMDSSYSELILARIAKESFEEVLKKNGILSFGSMLKTLDQTLIDKTLSFTINQDFDAVIIDEFQDTDPVQWSILKKLFIDHPVKAFYMVGDPKQAIYAFRAADVYTYMQAKQECPNLQFAALNTCFRSSKPFIDALNAFLQKTDWLRLPFLNKAQAYLPVECAEKQQVQKTAPFVFYLVEDSSKDSEILMGDVAIDLISKHKEDSVAILVKDRFQQERIESYLKSRSVSFNSLKSENLEGSIVYDLLNELLSFLETPLSIGSLNRFMASGFFNGDMHDFESKKLISIQPLLFELGKSLHSCFETCGLLVALEMLLDSTWPHQVSPTRLIITGLYDQNLISMLFEIALVTQKKAGPFSLAPYLKLTLEQLKKDNIKLPSVMQEQKGVFILTSHMSKGLEYDHVITLGIATRHASSSKILVKRNEGKMFLGLARDDESTLTALYDLEIEKIRQMYVALTRAKQSVHIPIISKPTDEINFGDLSALEFFVLLVKHPKLPYKELYTKLADFDLKRDIAQIFSESMFTTQTAVEPQEISRPSCELNHLNKTKKLCTIKQKETLSFSSLKTESSFEKNDDPLKGRDFGDLFHNLIESVFKNGHYKNFEDEKIQDYYRLLIKLSTFKEHPDQILTYLSNCLNIGFPTDDGQVFFLKNLPDQDIYVEKAFSYHTNLGVMKGFIDLACLYNNKIYFIDWKTSFLNQTTPEALELHMKKASYDLQLDIYKTALMLQSPYFNGARLAKAFYVFVKHGIFYEKHFTEALC